MFGTSIRHSGKMDFYRNRTPRSYQPCNFQYTNNKNLDYWCDTCDKGFGNQTLLDNHRNQHQMCNIDGCKFVAHPKVITRHIQMQHATGLYNRIVKSQDPEEIKKWREERKNKYPTKSNIEKKNAIWKEKMERGEKMALNEKKNKHDPGKSIQNKPHKNINLDRNKKKHKRAAKSCKITTIITPVENNKKLKAFCGIRQLLLEDENEVEQKPLHFNIEDEDWVAEPSLNIKKENNVCNALLTLVNNYDSADEVEEEKATAPVNIGSNKNTLSSNNINGDYSTSLKDYKISSNKMEFSDDDSPPQEEKNIKQDPININEITEITQPKNPDKRLRKVQNQSTCVKRPAKVIRKQIPSTLLHKLLSKEIKKERNIILQCIRHVVKNNYFKG